MAEAQVHRFVVASALSCLGSILLQLERQELRPKEAATRLLSTIASLAPDPYWSKELTPEFDRERAELLKMVRAEVIMNRSLLDLRDRLWTDLANLPGDAARANHAHGSRGRDSSSRVVTARYPESEQGK